MDVLTYSEIVRFLEKSGVRYDHLYQMVHYKQLYPIWIDAMTVVPYDSFIRFLDYNPNYRNVFYDYNPGGDCHMKKLKDEILDRMEKSSPVYDEEYSIEQIEKIFNVTKATIKKSIRKSEHPWRFLFRRNFSAVEILIYLKNHKDVLEHLKNRQIYLLSVRSVYEAPVRHILMLYSYFEGYGYII